MSAGQLITGGVVSRTVIVCAHRDTFPQSSVAAHVRIMTIVPPQPLIVRSL
jgi:hypothetical protein